MRPEPDDRVGSDAVPGNPRPRTVTGVRLGDLAARLAVDLPVDAAAVIVTGATHASQEVRPGDLYAALPGARRQARSSPP
ncbi:UDP-N-acetylmuramoyl-L-alanyl-D-glutamate--2,6-diaminopimelate ligase, partial [Micromonospora sp. STR1s_6]|nr:UDP-N-acetylmuramoyl-L-alanyl-D-glutamate--2,6-diaminopimelate ligase [Micromonospora tarensis]